LDLKRTGKSEKRKRKLPKKKDRRVASGRLLIPLSALPPPHLKPHS
jgi:hypothetical protein